MKKVENYQPDRKQRVMVNNEMSNLTKVFSGVL